LVLLLVATEPVRLSAQDNVSSAGGSHTDLGIWLRAGTLGFGAEVSKLLAGHVAARVGANYFRVSTTQTKADLFDLGAVLGKPHVSLTATGAGLNPQLASDLQQQAEETERDLRRHLKI
jgi:hypothetical protein